MRGDFSLFEYVDEFVNEWNRKVRRMRVFCILLAVLMILSGILCVRYPLGIFSFINDLAAASMILLGLYQIISYLSLTYFFRNAAMLVLGIVHIILGIMLLFMPPLLTSGTLLFMLGILLLFNGAGKLSFVSKLRYFRIMKMRSLTVEGVLNIILAVIFILLPYISMLVLNYVIAAYFVIGGVLLIIEAASLKKI